MEENLIGYLLDALDPQTQREVEAYLRTDEAGRQRLERLRQALAPLAFDNEPISPPPDLRVRTLARVAQYRSGGLPAVPERDAGPTRFVMPGWWRRADVLVAASILLCVGLLMPPALNYMRGQYAKTTCQNNLRVIYSALHDYSLRHKGEFPDVAKAAPPPRDVAGMALPMLKDEGLLRAAASCPSNGEPAEPLTTAELRAMTPEEFDQHIASLAGSYAYSLGYRDALGRIVGPRLDADQPNDHLPIMADRPPFGQGSAAGLLFANSVNHGGDGQNVLFSDGHVIYSRVRTVGVNGDDIFLNQNNKVEAGLNALDTVLGACSTHPSLADN
jgi:hypothetical protein